MKKKHKGHYCKVCGEHKANEKFSGKGHATHICKVCSALPLERRNEIQRINRIEGMGMNFFIPADRLGLLKKYAGDKRYPEAAQYAKETLEGFQERRKRYEEDRSEDEPVYEPVTPEELDDEDRELLLEDMEEFIYGFIADAGYIPREKDRQKIIKTICGETYGEEGKRLIPCEGMNLLFDNILQVVIKDSIRIAEKTGMRKTEEYAKTYREKEILHFVYKLSL